MMTKSLVRRIGISGQYLPNPKHVGNDRSAAPFSIANRIIRQAIRGAKHRVVNPQKGPSLMRKINVFLIERICAAIVITLLCMGAPARAQQLRPERTIDEIKTEAITRAWNSPDLTPADRIRVAKLVADEIDATSALHAVPGPAYSLENIAQERLPAPDAPELMGLTLKRLLN